VYVVHNSTDRTIMISDLRAEIKPRGLLDLDHVATRSAIDNSKYLQGALRSKILHLGRHSVIRTKTTPKPVQVIEKERDLDEQKLTHMIRQMLKEESPPKTDVQSQVKEAVKEGVDSLLSSIRDQIHSIQPVVQQATTIEHDDDNLRIDPKKFAEISQNAVEKISQDIELGGAKLGKQYKINKNLRDLADDL